MTGSYLDFHTHPFLTPENNFCYYRECCPMDADQAREYLTGLGIGVICGSVLARGVGWETVRELNRQALCLRDRYGGFYLPGIHVHPDFVGESVAELEAMAARGVKLVGELVPYLHSWDFSHPGLVPILEAVRALGMIVSFHSTGVGDEVMEPLLDRFPDLIFVAAHPGEDRAAFFTHLGRMERHGNYYLDISGRGVIRMGLLRCGIDRAGKGRFLLGSDFPICPPAMFLAAVRDDPLLTEDEKAAVLGGNARRLLGL